MSDFKLKLSASFNANAEALSFSTRDVSGHISREVIHFKEQAIRRVLMALGWQPPAVAHLDVQQGFASWWQTIGSGMPPLPGEDKEEHTCRIAQLAWEAAFAAEIEAMRVAIKEAHDALANVSTTFGRTPAQDAALSKLQPFLKP